MRATELLRLILLIILISGGVVDAQSERKNLDQLIAATENITLLKTSENGEWVGFAKEYDKKLDTLVLINTQSKKKKFTRSGITNYEFLTDDVVLINYGNTAEWFNLRKNRKKLHQNITKTYISQGRNFWMMQSDDKIGTNLGIYSSQSGEKISEIYNVQKVFDNQAKDIFGVVTAENNSKNHSLYLWKAGKFQHLGVFSW